MKRVNTCNAFACAVALLMLALVGCGRKSNQSGSEVDSNAPVDFSDMISYYEKQGEESEYWDVASTFCGFDIFKELENDDYFVNDTSFAVQLPQYAHSEHPFLSTAEVFYNACLFGHNVYSDFEVWIRGDQISEEKMMGAAMESVVQVDESCIRDEALQQAARTFKDRLVATMQDTYEEDVNPYDDYFNVVTEYAYAYYDDADAFREEYVPVVDAYLQLKYDVIEKYRQLDEEKRLKFILNALNECNTFEEQCSLFINWANCHESIGVSDWLVAVAWRLLDSEQYQPFLSDLWIAWRALTQVHCGLSRDSEIPHDYYNEMRKKCYKTCLQYIESHPDDLLAMNCAAVFAGRTNIFRYGQFPYGNDVASEIMNLLLGRYEEEEDEE